TPDHRVRGREAMAPRNEELTMSIMMKGKAGWALGGVAAALVVGASMGFTLRGTSTTAAYNWDIPVRTAPEVRGYEVAQLTAPPMVPGPINRNYPTTVEVNLEA